MDGLGHEISLFSGEDLLAAGSDCSVVSIRFCLPFGRLEFDLTFLFQFFGPPGSTPPAIFGSLTADDLCGDSTSLEEAPATTLVLEVVSVWLLLSVSVASFDRR